MSPGSHCRKVSVVTGREGGGRSAGAILAASTSRLVKISGQFLRTAVLLALPCHALAGAGVQGCRACERVSLLSFGSSLVLWTSYAPR